MRKPAARSAGPRKPVRGREHGNARILVLALACLAVGFAGGAFWYHRLAAAHVARVGSGPAIKLSDRTKAVLQRLDSPVEIRFYALLDQENVSNSVHAFAGRVDRLLSEFERAANGRIQVARHRSQEDAHPQAATSDGLKPLDLDKGETSYLGLIVARNDQMESLPQLAPEWEQALEADLTRAIMRVTLARSGPANPPAEPSPSEIAAEKEVQRSLPNLASLSVEEGTRILRTAALEEFKVAATEMQAQVEAAQERFSQMQNGPSEIERQAAREQLKRLQAAQAERLKAIAVRLEAQTAALARLKAVSPSPASAKKP